MSITSFANFLNTVNTLHFWVVLVLLGSFFAFISFLPKATSDNPGGSAPKKESTWEGLLGILSKFSPADESARRFSRGLAIVGYVLAGVVYIAPLVFLPLTHQPPIAMGTVTPVPVVQSVQSPIIGPTNPIPPTQPDIFLCLTTTSYTPDFNPPPDHGILHPAYLKTGFILVNRSAIQGTVISVRIDIRGRISSGSITQNSVNWKPTKSVVVAGNAVVPDIQVSIVIDVATEITSFQSAESQVILSGGLGTIVNHTFTGAVWQNNPTCSS